MEITPKAQIKYKFIFYVTMLVMITTAGNLIAQTTVNFNTLTTDTDQTNPFNHLENSVTWTLTVSGNSANIHTWGDGTVNFQTGPNGTLGSAKATIVRQDGSYFNFKGIKLEASIQDQHISIYGKNNDSVIYGPTSVDLVTGSLIQTFSPSGWNAVDEIEIIITTATTGTGGYDNDMYLFIDDFQYTMNVAPTISNLNGDSGIFIEGGSALTLDSGTAASVTDADATGYNGGNVTASLSSTVSSEDLIISTAGTVSLSAGMTAGSTVSVSSTSIGTIASGKTGQDGTDLKVTLNSNATDANIGTLLQNITYTNDSQNPSGLRTVGVTVTDAASGTSSTANVIVTLQGTNDAPVLDDSQSPGLTGIAEDAGDDDGSGADGDDDDSNNSNNPGTTVATIVVDGSITDPDGGAVEAIAVTVVDNTNGLWQYSTNNGLAWNNFSGITGSSVDISSAARLLDGTLGGASTHKIRFVPDLNFNGMSTITFRAWDKSSGSAGSTADASSTGGTTAFSSASDNASISVSAVNDAPLFSNLDGTPSFTEGGSVEQLDNNVTISDLELDVLNGSNGNYSGAGLTIIRNGGANANDRLSAVSGGNLTVVGGPAGGGTISVGGNVIASIANTGNGQIQLTFANNGTIPTQALVNEVMQAIRYSNASDDPSSSVQLNWSFSDGNSGDAQGTGANPATATGSVTVGITGVNDPPTISGLPANITVLEDVASNVNLSAATFGDVDAGANSIKLSIKAGAGILSVAASAGLSFNGNATDSITITGTASNIDTYLNTASNILYTGASNVNGNDVTTLTLIANDQGYTGSGGGSNITLGTVNVDITAVNDPPVLGNINGDTPSVVAGGAAANIDVGGDATVTNPDSPDNNGGFLTIVRNTGAANGSFSVDGTNVTSGGDASIAAGETIAVGGISIGTVHGTEDGQGGNTFTINFNTVNATNARLEMLLRNIKFAAPSTIDSRTFTITINDADGTTDSGDEDGTADITISVTPNPPVLSNIDGDNATIPIGGSAGNIDVVGNATVTDADSPNFDTGFISIVQNTGTVNGNFSVDGTNVTSGGDAAIAANEAILVGATTIGTVHATNNGQGVNNLTITFNSDANLANVTTLLRNIKYIATSGAGDRTFTISITDASTNSATGTANITITMSPPEMDLKQGTTAIADAGSYNYGNKAINSNSDIVFTIHNTAAGVLSVTTPLTLGGADAGQFSIQSQPSATVAANDSTTFTIRFTPTSTGAKTATMAITNSDTDENPYNLTLNGNGNTPPTGGNDEITIYEDETYTFAVSDFTFSDPDTDTFDGIQLQSLETAGTLTYNGIDAATSLDYPDMTKLKFAPASNANGSPYATFTFKVIDNNGGYSTASYTMTINVNPLPDIPLVIRNVGFTIEEGGTYTFSDNNLKFIDNDGPSFSLIYNIVQAPLHGTLQSTGPSGSITQNDIANGDITYIHNGDESTTDSFSFTVQDSEGNLSIETTFQITVLGINDPPVISPIPAITMNEDEIYSLNTSSWLEFVSDPDNPISILSYVISTGSFISVSQTDPTQWNIIPAANYFGNTEISLTVSDDSTSVTSIIQVTVQPINDLPELVGLPDSLLIPFGGNTSFTVNGTDLETASNLLTFEVTFTEGITAAYNDISGTVTVTAVSGFSGESLLTVSVSDTDGGTTSSEIVVKVGDSPTGLERINGIPEDYTLYQNYPNPFNPTTTILYGIPSSTDNLSVQHVQLKIYDILGSEVETLINEELVPGYYERTWNASNVSSGIYMCVLRAGSYLEVRKMLLIK